MKCIIGKYGYWLLTVSCWLLVVGCSSDQGDSRTDAGKGNSNKNDSPLQVAAAYTTNYQTISRMRAVTAGYSLLETQKDVAIGLFAIQTSPATDAVPTAKLIRYSNGLWHTQVVVEENYQYILYGYMPMQTPITGAVNKDSHVMTLSNINAVMADDICFVTGVKEGKNSDSGDLLEGNFSYNGKESDNYVCLLMDHLYAAIKVNFTIDSDYSALRTIKLKSMTLESSYEQVTAAITLSAVPATIVYTPTTGTASATFFEDAEGLDISDATDVAKISSHLCCFAPIFPQTLTLVSTYDVYDWQGNLIRKDCKSTNQLPSLESSEIKRGDCLTLNLDVNPTYIYQLSDQDLDNLIEIK